MLAIQYNDTSIAEQRSLFLGFSELLKPEYKELRTVIFPQVEDYRRFRKAVINLVLVTDIASPERTQLAKSKWKEAFGDPYETVERKIIKHMERRASVASSRGQGPPPTTTARASRRMSTQSIMSELTLESPVRSDDVEEDESVTETPETSDDERDRGQASNPSLRSNTSAEGGPIFRPVTSNTGDTSTPLRDNVTRAGPPELLSPFNPTPTQGMRKMRKLRESPVPIQSNARAHSLDGSFHSMSNISSGPMSGIALKFHRRLSSIGPGPAAKRYRNQRLGLLRTVDLSGQEIETYSHALRVRTSATGASTSMGDVEQLPPPEEVDELCETVILETIMKAADVAHNLQGWDLMAKFSNRLFLELRRAYVQGRGDDPQNGWFGNQIGFLEAYLLPLARKLDDTGVFGDTIGAMFAQQVEDNRDRWSREGMALTASIIQEGDRIFPEEGSENTDDD